MCHFEKELSFLKKAIPECTAISILTNSESSVGPELVIYMFFLSKMDGSWLDEDHHDFLEELKMEILEEKKKEGILQAASRMKQV